MLRPNHCSGPSRRSLHRFVDASILQNAPAHGKMGEDFFYNLVRRLPRDPEMSPDLIRQRRNLMIVSVTIIFLRFGGVTVEKVGAMGLELNIANRAALYVGLWMLFLYFLIRYYQYFMQESNHGIRTEFLSKMDALCLTELRKIAQRQHPIPLEELSGTFQFSKLSGSGLQRKGEMVIGRDSVGGFLNGPYYVNVLKLLVQAARAGIHVVFNRPAVTDYLLPFAVAAVALLYGGSGAWPGALCSVLSAAAD